MLDKKQIRAIFLFEFKMGCKEVETTHNIKKAFGPGTANERTVQWWFKKFCKGDERLEDEECSSQPSEADKDQWRADQSSKLILLQWHKKLLKNSTWTILRSFGIWSKLERWKSLTSGWPQEMITNQKNHHFEMSSLSLSNSEPFLDWIVTWQKVDFMWQLVTTSVAGLIRSSKALPKANC